LAKAYANLARLHELLQASQMEAEMARRAKEAFVANVSHELRTPLNMIIGFSELLQNTPAAYGVRLPDALLSDLGVIQRNSRHLTQLIDDVLDLSQLEVGQMSLHRQPVEAIELVQEAVAAVRPLYQAKGLVLTFDHPEAVPQVFWDRLRIRQVLLNLLSNAGRFTEVGGVNLHMDTTPHEVHLNVRDTGPGIPLEHQQRIFEPFEQVDSSTKRDSAGNGLGLTISKRLVELHGGRLWLESSVGEGSTFHVRLPHAAALLDGQSAKIDSPAQSAMRWINHYTNYEPPNRPRLASLPKPRQRVLVMEEEDVLSHQTEVYLQDAEVTRVASLADLMAKAEQIVPHLVIINDAQIMAEQGTVRALLKLPSRTPIISCYVPGVREACERLNVVDYLIKPVSEALLLTAVQRMASYGASILVVEDDAEMGRLIVRQLTAAGRGYQLLRATQGTRALELIRTRRPDAILLDLGLPALDGYEVLIAKNADPTLRDIPVAIVSARDPWGAPVMTNRMRIELLEGLSGRDVIASAAAVTQALSPQRRLSGSTWQGDHPD
jgi:nitrogen-specific signal transduction histidine kinase/CheY-like chemotaxis protein